MLTDAQLEEILSNALVDIGEYVRADETGDAITAARADLAAMRTPITAAAESEEDARETIKRQRRTIRALVVAFRAAWWALRHMGGHQPFFISMVRSQIAYFNRMGVTSEWEILDIQRESEREQTDRQAKAQ